MKFSQLILSRGLTPCEVDPTVFSTSTFSGCIILVVYVDDIHVIGNDNVGITRVKAYLHQHLTIRDIGTLKYFLGIEFTYRLRNLVLNQQKNVINILTKVVFPGCKPHASPNDSIA